MGISNSAATFSNMPFPKGCDAWQSSIYMLRVRKKKDVRLLLCDSKQHNAQPNALCMIASQRSQGKGVTCDEPNGKYAEEGTRRVIRGRISFTSF